MNYFAYGSNMDVDQMASRCPGAVLVGRALLPEQAFRINTHGVATVIPAKGSDVHGVLWKIAPAHEASLDRYEGVASGFYRKAMVRVRLAEGPEVEALCYIAGDDRPGRARPGYMERVQAAGENHRLPDDYILALRSRWGTASAPRAHGSLGC
ncbi:MAG: gamma-glutamylcyclotransferase family protein [Limisphaerales bacterium]